MLLVLEPTELGTTLTLSFSALFTLICLFWICLLINRLGFGMFLMFKLGFGLGDLIWLIPEALNCVLLISVSFGNLGRFGFTVTVDEVAGEELCMVVDDKECKLGRFGLGDLVMF